MNDIVEQLKIERENCRATILKNCKQKVQHTSQCEDCSHEHHNLAFEQHTNSPQPVEPDYLKPNNIIDYTIDKPNPSILNKKESESESMIESESMMDSESEIENESESIMDSESESIIDTESEIDDTEQQIINPEIPLFL